MSSLWLLGRANYFGTQQVIMDDRESLRNCSQVVAVFFFFFMLLATPASLNFEEREQVQSYCRPEKREMDLENLTTTHSNLFLRALFGS